VIHKTPGRRLFLSALSALAVAAAVGPAAQTAGAPQTPGARIRATISELDWLGGTWIGASGATAIEERWTPAAGGAMLGVARTIAGDRMTAFEFLRIIARDGSLVYIAQPNGRPPTEFALSAITQDSATFENPAHDFPKVIRYRRRSDGTLEARVSDGGTRSQTFEFKRQAVP
jgi:Domain of unknown function (DUF6265)